MKHTLEKHKSSWTKDEDFYLKLNYKDLRDNILARKLKRTESSIICRRHHLRLKRGRPKTALIIRQAIFERYQIIALNNKVQEMKYLIEICEKEQNTFRKEKYKAKLRKLSGL